MPEIQVITNLGYGLVVPRSARFPREVHRAPLYLLEELSKVLDVLVRLPKLCRALEEDRAGLESFGARECCLEAFHDNVRRFEEAGLRRFFFGELLFYPLVGRARRFMRDQLPGLECEFEISGQFRSPFFKCFDLRGLVEGMLYLDAA